MIRRSPAELYLQYLILHPKKYTNAQITEIAQFAQVDYLGEWYLNRLRAHLTPPKPFHPFDRDHQASRTFLQGNGLVWLFDVDTDGRKAFKMLELPRVKEFAESMSISNAPSAAIAYGIKRQHKFDCTARTIDRFQAFFWNVHLLDSSELRALLQLRYAQLEDHTDPQIKKQHDLMKRSYYSDSRKLAADLPFSPLSAMLSQMKMGLMPANIDVAGIIETTQKYAAIRLGEALLNNGRGDSSNALNFSIVLEKVTAVKKEVGAAEEDLHKQLSTIALRTDIGAIPTVHALTSGGGSFTVETGPKEIEHELPTNVDDGESGDGGGQPPV